MSVSHYHIHSHKSLEKWFLIAILIAAFLFRFQNLTTTPPGLYPDEAVNGTDALKALDSGNFKVFYENNNGREGLFINIQALFLKIFGAKTWALRLPSAIFGFLTVIGLYLFTRIIFNWQIAALAGWFMATGFWHVVFSRIGFRAILAPFLMVWAFYFLWKGLTRSKIWAFAIAGIFLGLGFYTYIGFRAVPLIAFLAILAYWQKIQKDFSNSQYSHLRNELWRGFAILIVVTVLMALPLTTYFLSNPENFFGRAGQVSVFESENYIWEFAKSFGKTMGMFNFLGDLNWRHNFSGSSQLFWPVGVFFAVGFIRSFRKLIKRYKEHGHVSSVQLLLLSWFFIMLLPAVLTTEGLPHALRSIGILPVVMIFAAEGAWWLFELIKHWYRNNDLHPLETHSQKEHEASVLVGLVLVIFLFSVGTFEYDKYFNKWGKNPAVADAFSSNFAETAKTINSTSEKTKKYVVVNSPGVLVDSLPVSAQTIMFLTKTYTHELQKSKNVYYILPEDLNLVKDKNAIILPLLPMKN